MKNPTPPIRNRYHKLKTWPEYFYAVRGGQKTFEVRRADRDFRVGDLLCLEQWCPTQNQYVRNKARFPETVVVRVTYILPGGQFGIEPGFVVMGISRI